MRIQQCVLVMPVMIFRPLTQRLSLARWLKGSMALIKPDCEYDDWDRLSSTRAAGTSTRSLYYELKGARPECNLPQQRENKGASLHGGGGKRVQRLYDVVTSAAQLLVDRVQCFHANSRRYAARYVHLARQMRIPAAGRIKSVLCRATGGAGKLARSQVSTCMRNTACVRYVRLHDGTDMGWKGTHGPPGPNPRRMRRWWSVPPSTSTPFTITTAVSDMILGGQPSFARWGDKDSLGTWYGGLLAGMTWLYTCARMYVWRAFA